MIVEETQCDLFIDDGNCERWRERLVDAVEGFDEDQLGGVKKSGQDVVPEATLGRRQILLSAHFELFPGASNAPRATTTGIPGPFFSRSEALLPAWRI